jgi:phage terminase small subunit
MPLNPKQEHFVAEYLIDLNATQAAIRAGYSKKTAKSQGQRLLTNVDIAAAVVRAQGDRTERTNITQDYVLESIFAAMERCKQADSFNATGVFKGAEPTP